MALKNSNICSEFWKDALDPSKIRVVSSAYRLILICCPSTNIPLILLCFLIGSARTSAHRINK